MKQKTFSTVREYFHWLYANLAMAHVALKKGHAQYEQIDYMVRSKLYKGLNCQTMHIASIYEDEKYKLSNVKCAYCSATEHLSLDHLFPRSLGGTDSGENLVYACSSYNSSKSNKDLLVWRAEKQVFPPILVLRRYLKLVYQAFEADEYLDLPFDEFANCCGQFHLNLLPYEFPDPQELTL